MSEPPNSFRREAAVVAVFTLVGAVLRFWGLGRFGLVHFDEGIYAIAGLWIQSPKGVAAINPELISYAPPLFPILVGVSYLVFGVSDVAAILVSQVAGILTIPAIAWVARRTFGPGAGAAAAVFTALSGPHVAFSRMALTDSTFVLCWVLALGFGMRFLERPGIVRAIVFGLAVGVAQNAKYNGYLAGMIVAGTAVWGLVFPSANGRRGAILAIVYGLVAAGAAALVYWPWYQFVDNHGGYAALIRHHRSYLYGPARWPGFAKSQLDQAVALSGLLYGRLSWGAAAWVMAWLGCGIAANGFGLVGAPSRWAWPRFRLGLLAGMIALGVWPELSLWIGLAMSPFLLKSPRPASRVLAIGWIAMAVLTPFYHPYARLVLPLHALGWILVGGLIVEIGRFGPSQAEGSGGGWSRRRWLVTAGVIGLAVFVRGPFFRNGLSEPAGPIPSAALLEPTDSLCLAVGAMASWASPPPGGSGALVRPPVAYYFALRGIPITRYFSLQALLISAPPGSMVLVDYAQLDQVRDSAKVDKRLMARMRYVGDVRYRLSPPTMLDTDPGISEDPNEVTQSVTVLQLFRLN